MMIPGKKYDSHLALRILENIAKLENPDLPSISDTLRVDRRKILTHIEGLKTLFVINELTPHPAGVGKPLYFLCDVALAKKLGASFEKQIWTCVINELTAKNWFSETKKEIFYFRSRGGSFIHLVEEEQGRLSALKIHPEEGLRDQDLRILRSFKERTSDKTKLFILSSSEQRFGGIKGLPWEAIA